MSGELKRKLGVPLLVFYGVGIMVGAGIYVLIGVVAGSSGTLAPLAFLLAGLVSLPTALSYAELSARMPKAAGVVVYFMRAFNNPSLATAVGFLVVTTSAVTAAVVLQGGVGYLQTLVPLDPAFLIVVIGAALVGTAIAGVVESLFLAAIFTFVEVAGLLIVSVAGLSGPVSPDWAAGASFAVDGGSAAFLIGVLLAFFAFIGFEDLVNMAEETISPERTLPRAIMLALAITTVLYMLVSFAAVRAVGIAALSESRQPLALIYETATGSSAGFLAVIAVAAAVNGVLAQIILAARMLFGMGRETHWLSVFYHAHPRFGTPVLATLLAGVAVILVALFLPLVTLAKVASLALLLLFSSVNLALIVIKRREPVAPFRLPIFVPWAGMLASGTVFLSSLIWM